MPQPMLHSLRYLPLLGAVLMTAATVAQTAVPVPPHNWRASWITSNDASKQGEAFLHVRKAFELDAVPEHFPVYVSADNQFELRVNGTRVGSGPSLSNPMHWRYETYDLAPFLHKGSNTIAATVWHLGDNAPLRQMSERLGFVLDSDPAAAVDLKTGKTWEVEVESGLSTLETAANVKTSYYVSSPGERIDGSHFDWKWDAAPNQSGAWKQADVIGQAAARGKNNINTPWQLVADALPAMERSERSAGKVVRIAGLQTSGAFPQSPLTIAPHSEVTLLLDAGQVVTAFPSLTLSGGHGATVAATYTEALAGPKNVKGNRNEIAGKTVLGIADRFLSDGAQRRTYTPLDWRTWRYLELAIATADEPLVLEDLKTEYTAFPFKKLAAFTSDDPELSRIWETGWDTLRICAHDTYMDTPYWERLQYLGDTRIEALITYATTADDRLPREAIEAFHNSLLSDGITLSRYPTREFQSIPGFSLYYIGMVHDFWMYRDDPAFVSTQLSAIRSTLSFFHARMNSNGLLGTLPWWPFVDWANGFVQGIPPQTSTGDSAILSLQVVEALRYAADIEDHLGSRALAADDRADADRIARRSTSSAGATRNTCWPTLPTKLILASMPTSTGSGWIQSRGSISPA